MQFVPDLDHLDLSLAENLPVRLVTALRWKLFGPFSLCSYGNPRRHNHLWNLISILWKVRKSSYRQRKSCLHREFQGSELCRGRDLHEGRTLRRWRVGGGKLHRQNKRGGRRGHGLYEPNHLRKCPGNIRNISLQSFWKK